MQNDVPNEVELCTSSKTAMTCETSGSKSHVTSKKQSNFLAAMKDSKFRILVNDYDITDVHNHNETVHRSSQRQHNPKDKPFLQITPGFVVKTKDNKQQKVFINVCSSDKMQPPRNSTKATLSQQSSSLTFPYSIGPKRLEVDKGGVNVPTFDVCFHPQVVELAMARGNYRHVVVYTCLDAIERAIGDIRWKPSAMLERKYHVLKGVFYKSGDPVPMCFEKDREVTESSQHKMVKDVQAKNKTEVGLFEDTMTMLDDKESITAAIDQAGDPELTQVEQVDDKTPLIKKVSSIKFDLKQKVKNIQQKKKLDYQLVYCGRFEHFNDLQVGPDNQSAGDGYRPKELVVEVRLPFSTSAKGIDLDVSERMLRLSMDVSVVGNYEPLELALPFPVFEDKGTARFDRTKRNLVVTLSVQSPPKSKPQSFSLIVQDDSEEEENELPRNIVATLKSKAIDDLSSLKRCGDEKIDTSELRAEETKSSLCMSAPIDLAPEDPIKPSFETHDTLKCLSYIINVTGIDSASVKLTFPSNSSLHLHFSDSDKHVYELHVAVLPVDIDPSTAEFDVASENMVVIFHKKYAATAFASRSEKFKELKN